MYPRQVGLGIVRLGHSELPQQCFHHPNLHFTCLSATSSQWPFFPATSAATPEVGLGQRERLGINTTTVQAWFHRQGWHDLVGRRPDKAGYFPLLLKVWH